MVPVLLHENGQYPDLWPADLLEAQFHRCSRATNTQRPAVAGILMITRSHNQRASEEPSLRAGDSQRIGVPSIAICGFRR
jgi:hypothetical protein